MINKNKLQVYQERLLFDPRPITAQISISRRCNLRCFYCFHRAGVTDGELMNLGDFATIAVRLKELGVRGVVFSGQGEPSLNPEFPFMLEVLRGLRLRVGVNSNFVRYFNPIGARWLKVNVDAGDSRQYAKIKGVDAFGEVVGNIKRIKRENRLLRVGVQCLAGREGDATRFYETFKTMDVDYMSIRPIDSKGTYYDPGRLERILTEVERLRGVPRVNVSFKWGFVGVRYERCYANWSTIAVRHDGAVAYCCSLWEEVVGHISQPGIIEDRRRIKFDMSKCPTPCRLSGLNDYVRGHKGGEDVEFC